MLSVRRRAIVASKVRDLVSEVIREWISDAPSSVMEDAFLVSRFCDDLFTMLCVITASNSNS